MSKKDKEYTIDYFEYQANETNKKYIEELDKVLTIYKRALELACEDIQEMYCSDYCMCTTDENCKGKCYYQIYFDKKQFIDKAKKELRKSKGICKTGRS